MHHHHHHQHHPQWPKEWRFNPICGWALVLGLWARGKWSTKRHHHKCIHLFFLPGDNAKEDRSRRVMMTWWENCVPGGSSEMNNILCRFLTDTGTKLWRKLGPLLHDVHFLPSLSSIQWVKWRAFLILWKFLTKIRWSVVHSGMVRQHQSYVLRGRTLVASGNSPFSPVHSHYQLPTTICDNMVVARERDQTKSDNHFSHKRAQYCILGEYDSNCRNLMLEKYEGGTV